MKENITHLNINKQEEINRILKIILKIGKNHIKPEMIILF